MQGSPLAATEVPQPADGRGLWTLADAVGFSETSDIFR